MRAWECSVKVPCAHSNVAWRTEDRRWGTTPCPDRPLSDEDVYKSGVSEASQDDDSDRSLCGLFGDKESPENLDHVLFCKT